VFNERQCGALGDLRMMVHPGAREFLRYAGAEARLGLQPVGAVVAVDGAVLDVEMVGIVANFVFGRLRRCGGRLHWRGDRLGAHGDL